MLFQNISWAGETLIFHGAEIRTPSRSKCLLEGQQEKNVSFLCVLMAGSLFKTTIECGVEQQCCHVIL